MYIKFWGVRGSVASGSLDTARVGGNTTCVEIRCDQELIIIDTGSGFHNLGMALMKELPIRELSCLVMFTGIISKGSHILFHFSPLETSLECLVEPAFQYRWKKL